MLEQAHERGRGHAELAWVAETLAIRYEAAGQLDKAERLYRESSARARKEFGAEHLRTASALAMLGLNLLKQRKWAEAEPIIRECLEIRTKKDPNTWSTFNTKSMLGAVFLGQKKYPEAEPLLLAGYEGLKAQKAKIPPQGKPRLTEAAQRLVQLYEATGKKDEAAKWQKELDALRAADKPREKKP
jgi:hypothetical protein